MNEGWISLNREDDIISQKLAKEKLEGLSDTFTGIDVIEMILDRYDEDEKN